jgi:cysteine desulfurase / selenocysteine lyase
MDLLSVQDLFPIKKRMIYLNNASISPLATTVVKAVESFLADVRDNGRINYPNWCRYADGELKERIGTLIGADKSEIAFVKNTTEGINIVANGIDWKDGDNVVIADIEYPSNVYPWINLERRGVGIKWIKTKEGKILVEDIDQLIDKRTRLVSLSGVQFSNGFRLDLGRVGELCRRRKVLFNLDMIQYIGALDLDLRKVHVDFLSAGGHKWLLSPIGTGIFYCRKESLDYIHPHNVGYHSVDKSEDHLDYDLTFRPNAGRFEEALVNFTGIWGLDVAIKLLLDLGMKNVEEHIMRLNEFTAEGLLSKGYRIISPTGEKERSGILSFMHPERSAEKILEGLDRAKIHVAIRADAIRISPTVYNDEEEMKAMLDALP